MFKKVHLTITALSFATIAFAQSGAIKVHMFDKATKQPIPFANVVVERGGVQVTGGVTDIDGYVTIKPLDPGTYDVKAVYEGYNEKEVTGIAVEPDKIRYEEMDMAATATQMKVVEIVKDRVPLVNPTTQTGTTITKEDYQHMAVKDVNSVAAMTAGVYQSDIGGALNFRGARSDATEYIVDGIKLTAGQALSGLPQSMIEEETTITGGTPANYGDATGGIVEINTTNASPVFFGSVEGITSELFDQFGHNDVNFSIGGPLLFKKDTATHTKIPIISGILGGEIKYDKDNSPSFVGAYMPNADTLAEIEKTPLLVNPQGGYSRAAEFITSDQIEHQAAHINNASESFAFNGKLDFRVNNNIKITAGGSYEYDYGQSFSYNNEFLNSAEDPLITTSSYRTFAKLTQRFPTPEGKDSKSIIRNAYYTIMASYSNTHDKSESPYFKDNVFDYGYVGQFQQYYTTQYALENGRYGLAYYQTTNQADSAYTFRPGTQNPLLANYTSEFYQLAGSKFANGEWGGAGSGTDVSSINSLGGLQGIINGGSPNLIYSMWNAPGTPTSLYKLDNFNHLDFTANFSADIKDHAVQVGFEYEQDVDSYYGLAAAGLWNTMRLNVNNQLTQQDTNHPFLVSQGQFNTYGYNSAYNPAQQTQFDKSLRAALGLPVNSTVLLQPDNYSPSMFSLNMFSATDLLGPQGGNVYYFGYDYKGNLNNSNASVDDFFNQVDANGNHTYPVAPYHPIYIAGYIQDHFDIKNLKFDVGVRVEDFNANQPVLKDPYLLMPAKTVAEVQAQGGLGEIPSNMGSNYVVYVNDIQSPTAIVGYRNGNSWYNASGNLVPDPSVLAAATTTGSIQPYLENPSQTGVSADAFTTYTPQVNVLPRIAFSFPISDVANFFAHYDILSQRPPGFGYNFFNPLDYLYISSNTGGQISNPNLLPQETTDYELGFEQVLDEAKTSALTISAFYRDNLNQVETYRYYDAYPVTYLSYNNIDFGTTKGMSVSYDLRRVNNIKIRASYTLQFATGTGSGPSSGLNLAASGQPNLEIPQPLSFDQRHTILLNIDYHYSSGESYNGPVWTTKTGKALQILANAGFNLSITAGSGTPYTAQSNATEGNGNQNGPASNVVIGVPQHYGLVGSINGEYLPWQFRVDLRVDKEFPVILKKSKGDKAKHCSLVVYIQALNLLNTENIQAVYAYTGSPSDDGFLTSVQGQQYVAQQTSPQAFTDQYKIKDMDPSLLSIPRQMRLGVQFNF